MKQKQIPLPDHALAFNDDPRQSGPAPLWVQIGDHPLCDHGAFRLEQHCSVLTLHRLFRFLDQGIYESRSSPRKRAQGKSLTDSRKSASLATRAIVFHSQDHHFRRHQGLRCAIRQGKKDLHLHQGVGRRTSGRQHESASHTHVSCSTITLVVPGLGPAPAERYQCIHSIANALPSFDRKLRAVCDLIVSTCPGVQLLPVPRRLWDSRIVHKWR